MGAPVPVLFSQSVPKRGLDSASAEVLGVAAYDEGEGCAVPSDDVAEFGGWPRPPRWVWAVAGVAAVAVLASAVIARTGPHHAAASSRSTSPAAAAAPSPGSRTPAAESAARWPSAAGVCASAAYLPHIRWAERHTGDDARLRWFVSQRCGSQPVR